METEEWSCHMSSCDTWNVQCCWAWSGGGYSLDAQDIFVYYDSYLLYLTVLPELLGLVKWHEKI